MKVLKTEIDVEKIKSDLIDNLQVEGYEDMLDSFMSANQRGL